MVVPSRTVLDKKPEERLQFLADNKYVVPDSVETVEAKDWKQGKFYAGAPRFFVHGSTVSPDRILGTGGLSPDFAREICLFSGQLDGQPIGKNAGRVVLAAQMETLPNEAGAARDGSFEIELPKIYQNFPFLGEGKKNWRGKVLPRRGYLYVFTLTPPAEPAAARTFFSANGTLDNLASEVGFDDLIPVSCIQAYSVKEGDYRAWLAQRVPNWPAPSQNVAVPR